MERARVLRVMTSQTVHLELCTGAIVSAFLSDPWTCAGRESICALKPMEVEVELGPYNTSERRFTGCRMRALEEAEIPEPRTTKFRRVK